MTKELIKNYADKIIEVVYYDTIPDKETVGKVIYALIDELSCQQTKELQENLYKESTRADVLQDENVKFQAKIDELEKSNEWISVEFDKWKLKLLKEYRLKFDEHDVKWLYWEQGKGFGKSVNSEQLYEIFKNR